MAKPKNPILLEYRLFDDITLAIYYPDTRAVDFFMVNGEWHTSAWSGESLATLTSCGIFTDIGWP